MKQDIFPQAAARSSALIVTLALALAVLLPIATFPSPVRAAPLFSAALVSDIGTGNSLADPNSARMVAVSPDGTIYVAYHGADGVRVARSTTRGQSFDPSVQITATNVPVSLTVDGVGIVYLAYVSGGEIFFSRSTDSGQTFSAPTSIASGIVSASVDIAVDAPYVYVLPRNGLSLFVNELAGVGAFTAYTTGLSSRSFSGIMVDPGTHEIFIIGDNPAIFYVKSATHGATFGSPVGVAGSVYFSTYIGGFGFIGQKVFVAGGQLIAGSGTAAVLVDLAADTGSSRTFGNNINSTGRSLAVDGEGNVVDGYSDGSNVMFAVSTDQGQTFGAPEVVAAGATRMELALNPTTNDIVAAYEKGGQIFINIYEGLLAAPPAPPTISAIANQTTDVDQAVGPIAITVGDSTGDPATVTLSGLSSDQSVVPNANISFGGSGTSRTMTITPAAGASGSATIVVVARNSQSRTAQTSFALTVRAAPAAQTISFPAPADTTYGAAPIALSATATSGLSVAFQSQTPSVCTVSGATLSIVAAGTCTLSADQAGDGSFLSAPQAQASFAVAKAPLAVVADDKTREFGAANPPLTYTATGFVNGESAAVLVGGLSTTATLGSPAGPYAISQGSLTAANYAISFTPGTLSVIAATSYKSFLPLYIMPDNTAAAP